MSLAFQAPSSSSSSSSLVNYNTSDEEEEEEYEWETDSDSYIEPIYQPRPLTEEEKELTVFLKACWDENGENASEQNREYVMNHLECFQKYFLKPDVYASFPCEQCDCGYVSKSTINSFLLWFDPVCFKQSQLTKFEAWNLEIFKLVIKKKWVDPFLIQTMDKNDDEFSKKNLFSSLLSDYAGRVLETKKIDYLFSIVSNEELRNFKDGQGRMYWNLMFDGHVAFKSRWMNRMINAKCDMTHEKSLLLEAALDNRVKYVRIAICKLKQNVNFIYELPEEEKGGDGKLSEEQKNLAFGEYKWGKRANMELEKANVLQRMIFSTDVKSMYSPKNLNLKYIRNFQRTVKLLIQLGINLNHQDAQKRTVFDYLKLKNWQKYDPLFVIDLIKNTEAKNT